MRARPGRQAKAAVLALGLALGSASRARAFDTPREGAALQGRVDAILRWKKAPACGPWGVLCAEPIPGEAAPAPDLSPLNTGFQALGAAGKGGSVDGPGSQGDGRYLVGKNDPYEVDLSISTGYIYGIFFLKRDPLTGKDTLRYSGKLWDRKKDEWGPYMDKTYDAQFVYDGGSDKGRLRWIVNGGWKEEGYQGGKTGRKMTIEFAGYGHDFEQDK